ncbi:MAG: hypothetical protein R3D05_04825 [Dongiaceae bacterium]
MIHRLVAAARGLDEHRQVLAQLLLADEAPRTSGAATACWNFARRAASVMRWAGSNGCWFTGSALPARSTHEARPFAQLARHLGDRAIGLRRGDSRD